MEMTKSKKIVSSSDAENHKKDTIRMNINLPRIFYKKIQHEALDQDMSVTKFVIEAIKNYMHTDS